MAIKWSYFFGAALLAAVFLLWRGAPLGPVLAGAAVVGAWNLLKRHAA